MNNKKVIRKIASKTRATDSITTFAHQLRAAVNTMVDIIQSIVPLDTSQNENDNALTDAVIYFSKENLEHEVRSNKQIVINQLKPFQAALDQYMIVLM